MSVVFGPADVPGTWKATGALVTKGRQSDGQVATGRRGYRSPDLAAMVGIGAESYQSVSDATARFRERKQQAAGAHLTSVSLAGVDEAIETTCIDCGGTIDFRVGTVVAWVSFSPDGLGIPQTGTIGTVASRFAERIRQVLTGHQPTVRLR